MVKIWDKFKAYRHQQTIGELIKESKKVIESGEKLLGDARYKVPKEEPKAGRILIEDTITKTEIYRRARLFIVRARDLSSDSRDAILNKQRKQVGYGLDKYPEPLNSDTWTISETVDHILDESMDKLHYLVMLLVKLEEEPVGMDFGRNKLQLRISNIERMIQNTINEMDYLVKLDIVMGLENQPCQDYSLKESYPEINLLANEDLSNMVIGDDASIITYAAADVEACQRAYEDMEARRNEIYLDGESETISVDTDKGSMVFEKSPVRETPGFFERNRDKEWYVEKAYPEKEED